MSKSVTGLFRPGKSETGCRGEEDLAIPHSAMDTPKSTEGAFDMGPGIFYDDPDASPEDFGRLDASQRTAATTRASTGGPPASHTRAETSPKRAAAHRKSFTEEGSQGKRTRASGEILTYLINEFNKNSNPTTQMRKAIAAKTGMPERSVRIWFQNRRAKARKMEKLQKTFTNGAPEDHQTGPMGGLLSKMDVLPIDINEKYAFIDSRCISVGTWQRIRTGNVNIDFLNEMVNLSPKIIYNLMETTDLLVVLSKKDQEINYFFSGVFQNDKVLFRIFYPIVSIVKSSILNQSQQPGEGEIEYTDTLLQIDLTTSPKFAVHFLRDPTTGKENLNQWSICEDFSEGQQVAMAHTGDGGSQIGHILTGDSDHLKYLNAFIMAELQSGGHRESSTSPGQFQSDITSSATSTSAPFPHTNHEGDLLHLTASTMNTPQYAGDYPQANDNLHDMLLYTNGAIGLNMAVFNGSGTIDSEGAPERSVDSPGLDLFRANTDPGASQKQAVSELDELDLGPMLNSSAVKNEYFINDDDFL